jgi:kumamolisin
LIALINQKLGRRVGFINPKIYDPPQGSRAFHDITKGGNRVSFGGNDNIGYDAGKGWDPCTGLGSPDGVELAKIL